MAYEVIKDVSIPKSIGPLTDKNGDIVGYQKEGHNYKVGAVILEDDISPDVLERLNDGDDHLAKFLVPISDEEVDENAGTKEAIQRSTGTSDIVPEHEQEAFAAEQAGHAIVEREAVVTDPKLEDLGVTALRERAKELEIKGRTNMTRQKLIDAIKSSEAAGDDAGDESEKDDKKKGNDK